MRGGHRRNILESDADASRLRKGLSLPSRRLVPCILAALTAGTVTLGALPCADAAPIVRSAVTEDIDAPEGVAGSIDGSAATITIGTEGGGISPATTRSRSRGRPDCCRHLSVERFRAVHFFVINNKKDSIRVPQRRRSPGFGVKERYRL